MTWDELKKQGSQHYKTGGIEPIDLLRGITPHSTLSALDVKALADNIKYSTRMLIAGANERDCNKIIHYTEMVRVCLQEKKEER
jgi:hypothetical protein